MAKILGGIRLGVQSWCYRDFKGTDNLIRLLHDSELDTIELCGTHYDFNDRAGWTKVIEELEAASILINGCGINGMQNNEESLRNQFEFARRAGISAIGADLDPDAIDLVEKLCEEYGVKVAIHNHGHWHRYGSRAQLRELFGKTSSNIGLCLDTGWALDSKENPLDYIDEFADRLFGVHLKDFNFDAEGQPLETVLGTGELDLPAIIAKLKEIHFAGYASLEYEGDASDPAPKLRACVENLRKIGA